MLVYYGIIKNHSLLYAASSLDTNNLYIIMGSIENNIY